MKKSKKDYPVTPAYDDIMFNEAGSSNECTGLIPSAVLTESEYDSYEALYDFCLPSSVKAVSYTHLTLPTILLV